MGALLESGFNEMTERAEFEKVMVRLGYAPTWAENGYLYEEMQVAWKAWQAARAQSGQDAEGAADFRAEIRTERDPCDEYVSYLTFISGGKSHPYLHIPETMDQDVLDVALCRLNTHPHNGEQGAEWVRSDERLPTEADSDALGFVWTFSKGLGVTVLDRHSFTAPPFYTHWKPTGLTRPQPPKSKEDRGHDNQ